MLELGTNDYFLLFEKVMRLSFIIPVRRGHACVVSPYCSDPRGFSLLHRFGCSSSHQLIQLRNFHNSFMGFSFPLIMVLLLNSVRWHFCSLQFTNFFCNCNLQFVFTCGYDKALFDTSFSNYFSESSNEFSLTGMNTMRHAKKRPFLFWQCGFNTCYI